MPAPNDILAQLSTIANDEGARAVAAMWHVVIPAVVLASLALGRWPSRRSVALLVTAAVASASAVAFAFGVVFNGVVLGATSAILLVLALRAPRIRLRRPRAVSATFGAGLLVLAWTYPHFREGTSLLAWFFVAPMGTLPCPSLALAVGVTLLTGLPGGRAHGFVLACAGLFYGLFGSLRLGVGIDAWLAIGAAFLALRFARRTSLAATAARSVARVLGYLVRRRIHQPRRPVRLDIGGGSFVAMRETVVDVPREANDERAVLAVFFQLWFVSTGSRVLARLFWRLNAFTIPFFAGCEGFVSKLWMEDRPRAEYVGIYEFTSPHAARAYAEYIRRVLLPFARRGSISSEVFERTNVERFIAARAQRGAGAAGVPRSRAEPLIVSTRTPQSALATTSTPGRTASGG